MEKTHRVPGENAAMIAPEKMRVRALWTACHRHRGRKREVFGKEKMVRQKKKWNGERQDLTESKGDV